MGAAFTALSPICIELVNGSDPSVGLGVLSSNQEWLKALEFYPLFVLSDAKVARMICNTKGLGARKTFLTGSQTAITNGAQLNASIGEVEDIQFVVTGGKWAGTQPAGLPRGSTLAEMLRELSIENRNVTANPEIPPHYVQIGSTIHHNRAALLAGGASAVSVNATYCEFTINFSATSCQCPGEYSRLIAIDALAAYFAKDGQKVQAASYFNSLAEAEMATLGIATKQNQIAA
jgi:hypothetical protein